MSFHVGAHTGQIGTAVAGGTAGSVLFVDTGGVLGQNNASFFWDNVNVILTASTIRIFASGSNMFVGPSAGNLASSATQGVGIGYQALSSQTTAAAFGNTACGYQAVKSCTSGHSNTGFGTQALSACTTGINNGAVGYALSNAIDSQNCVAIGDNSQNGNLHGINCVSLGYNSLFSSTADTSNVAIGSNALYTLNGANNNTAVGTGALYSVVTGGNNTACGLSALYFTTTANNAGFGEGAGQTNTVGAKNTYLGTLADASANNWSSSVAIGYNSIVGASSTMTLGGTGADAVSVVINGTTAGARLDVIDSAAAQLRLSNVSASKYASFTVDGTGALTLAQAGGGTLVTFSGLSLALGSTPATAGTIRLPNNSPIDARNAANSSNLNLIFADASNQVNVGVSAIFDTSGGLWLGAIPAAGGQLRMVTGAGIRLRNAANGGDITAIEGVTLNAVTDIIRVGNTSAGVVGVARSGAGTPSTTDIPAGQWAVWRDTSGGTTKIYYNNAGAIIASAAFA